MTDSPYRSNWLPLVAGLLLIVLFVRLGIWQLDRAEEKRGIIAAAAEAPHFPANRLGAEQPPRYASIRLDGRFDRHRHILLDNQVLNGRPGVHVWTPFHAETHGLVVLVNRGWLPMAADRSLPLFTTPDGFIHIEGRVNQTPRVGQQLGNSDLLSTDQWPQLVTYMDLDEIAKATGLPLQNWIVQLAPDHPAGFSGRDWPVVNFGPAKHLSYAYTWFTMAACILAIIFLLHWRARARRTQA